MDNQMILKGQQIKAMIDQPDVRGFLHSLLGNKLDQAILALMSIAQTSNKLAECSRETLLGGVVKALSLDLKLDPNFGECWLIPRQVSVYDPVTARWAKEQQAIFQMGWKGYKTLALRTGRYKTLTAMDVREGEYVGLDDNGDPVISFSADINRRKLPLLGFMAKLILNDGYSKSIFWTAEEMTEHHQRYSDSYRQYAASLKSDKPDTKSAWATSYDAMAKKTILSHLLRTSGDISTAGASVLTDAYKADQAAIKYLPTGGKEFVEEATYIDNQEPPIVVEYLSTAQIRALMDVVGPKGTPAEYLRARQEIAKSTIIGLGYPEVKGIPASDFNRVMDALALAFTPVPDVLGGADDYTPPTDGTAN